MLLSLKTNIDASIATYPDWRVKTRPSSKTKSGQKRKPAQSLDRPDRKTKARKNTQARLFENAVNLLSSLGVLMCGLVCSKLKPV